MPRLSRKKSGNSLASSPGLNFAFIVYPKVRFSSHFLSEKVFSLSPLFDYVCVSPLHSSDSEDTKPHYHCLVKLKKPQRDSFIDSLRDSSLAVSVSPAGLKRFESVRLSRLVGVAKSLRVSDFGAYYRYLTHENDGEKQQFCCRPAVFGSCSVDDLDNLFLSFVDKQVDEMKSIYQFELDILKDGDYINYSDFVLRYPSRHGLRVGSLNWFQFRTLTRNRASHFRNFFKDISEIRSFDALNNTHRYEEMRLRNIRPDLDPSSYPSNLSVSNVDLLCQNPHLKVV